MKDYYYCHLVNTIVNYPADITRSDTLTNHCLFDAETTPT